MTQLRESDRSRTHVFGLVLAAGQSTRMGEQKLLLKVDEGKTLIRHVLDTATQADLDGLLVVVSSRDEQMQKATATGSWQQVVNPHAERGMSTSLHMGVSMLERSAADGIIVLLGDMPDVTPGVVNRVVDRFRKELQSEHGKSTADSQVPLIVQASYRGVPSHPVLFSRALFPELLEVEGDEGGKSVVAKHKAHRIMVEIETDVPVDLDTPESYKAWLSKKSQPKD